MTPEQTALIAEAEHHARCDSDLPQTCRDNWPEHHASWCVGCVMSALVALVREQAQEIERVLELTERFSLTDLANSYISDRDTCIAACNLLAEAKAERDALRQQIAEVAPAIAIFRDRLVHLERRDYATRSESVQLASVMLAFNDLADRLSALTATETP